MKERLSKLLTVKSIVTVMLCGVFSYLSVVGKISGEQFLVIFTTVIAFYFGTQHEKKGKQQMKNKTNIGLVQYANKAIGLPYWNGTFGQVASESLYQQKKRQLPGEYTATDFKEQYGKIVHDCNGLIKGYMWKDSFTSPYKYQSNGMPDVSVEGMYSMCEQTGDISSIPDIVGLLVFKMSKGSAYHVGVYVGNGEVVEAKGHAYGVIKSSLKTWHKWGKLSCIEYITEEDSKVNVSVIAFQKSAMADGFKFPKYGADGEWGAECESVAKQAIVRKWPDGKYRNKNLTALAQRLMGMPSNEVDGLCGNATTKYIINAQKKFGLLADGHIGINTWKKLLGI